MLDLGLGDLTGELLPGFGRWDFGKIIALKATHLELLQVLRKIQG